jgi:hypothetical protein
VREHAPQGEICLAYPRRKSDAHRILAEQPLLPERVKYYLERRDPEFETKMREVLLVYQEVSLQNQNGGGMIPMIITVSVDEKPGLQAVANTAPDLPPVPGKHSGLGRDHEYKRLGTGSMRRHRSREFVALLKDLDAHYPAESVLRLIMDNHSAHISRETQAFLASRPNRFQYVLTPKHGSWLNQCRSRRSSVEEVRGSDHRIVYIGFSETTY